MNYDKHPYVFTTNVEMGGGYPANGDHKNTLEYMKAALLRAPDPIAKSSVEEMIKKLHEGSRCTWYYCPNLSTLNAFVSTEVF